MSWFILVIAGLFEVAWAVGLKYTEGFSRLWPSVLTVAAMIVSFYLLSAALRTLPLSTAYAVWVGIGAVGTVIVGALFFQEVLTPLKLVSLVLVIAGIVGLRLAT